MGIHREQRTVARIGHVHIVQSIRRVAAVRIVGNADNVIRPVYAIMHKISRDRTAIARCVEELNQDRIGARSQGRLSQVQSPPLAVTMLFGVNFLPVYVNIQEVIKRIGKSPRLVRCTAIPHIS